MHVPDTLGIEVDLDDKFYQFVFAGWQGGSVWSSKAEPFGPVRGLPIGRLDVGTTVEFGELDRENRVVRIICPLDGWMCLNDGNGEGEDFFDSDSLVVKAVYSGPVQLWNQQHLEHAIEPGHRIVAVNGVRGGAKQLTQMLQSNEDNLLRLQIRRPCSAKSFDKRIHHPVGMVRFLQSPAAAPSPIVHQNSKLPAEAQRSSEAGPEARERAALAEMRARDAELVRVQADLQRERERSDALGMRHAVLAEEHATTTETLRSQLEDEASRRREHQEAEESLRKRAARVSDLETERRGEMEQSAREKALLVEKAEAMRMRAARAEQLHARMKEDLERAAREKAQHLESAEAMRRHAATVELDAEERMAKMRSELEQAAREKALHSQTAEDFRSSSSMADPPAMRTELGEQMRGVAHDRRAGHDVRHGHGDHPGSHTF